MKRTIIASLIAYLFFATSSASAITCGEEFIQSAVDYVETASPCNRIGGSSLKRLRDEACAKATKKAGEMAGQNCRPNPACPKAKVVDKPVCKTDGVIATDVDVDGIPSCRFFALAVGKYLCE